MSLTIVRLSNRIPLDNACLTTCCFKTCRGHINKVLIQGVGKLAIILINSEIIASYQLNSLIFTYYCISLGARLLTTCAHLVCGNLPCLVSCGISNSFQLVFRCSSARYRRTVPCFIGKTSDSIIVTINSYITHLSLLTCNSPIRTI